MPRRQASAWRQMSCTERSSHPRDARLKPGVGASISWDGVRRRPRDRSSTQPGRNRGTVSSRSRLRLAPVPFCMISNPLARIPPSHAKSLKWPASRPESRSTRTRRPYVGPTARSCQDGPAGGAPSGSRAACRKQCSRGCGGTLFHRGIPCCPPPHPRTPGPFRITRSVQKAMQPRMTRYALPSRHPRLQVS